MKATVVHAWQQASCDCPVPMYHLSGAQAALMRLTRDAPAVAAAGELLEAMKAENAQLQVHRCVSHLHCNGTQ